jgi:hypothetical protein
MLRAITYLVVLSFLLPRLAAAQDARLLVTVIADGAGPVQDAQVRVYQHKGPGFDETLVARGKTTESGRVAITVAPGKAYKVRISHPAYGGPHEVDVHPPAGDIAVPVRLYGFGPALEPASAEIARDVRGVLRGQVLSSSGEPLSKLFIRAKAAGPSMADEYHTLTREDGSYRLAVRPGRYSVEAGGFQSPSHEFTTAPIFIDYERTQSQVVPVERGYATTVNLSLPPAFVRYNVTVSLIDASNQPVDNADLITFGRRAARSGLPQSSFMTMTHARDGKPAPIGPLIPGPVTIVARSVGGLDPLAGVFSLDVQEWPQEVTLRLFPAARITGRVEFAGRDTPLHGTSGLRLRFEPVGWPGPGYYSTEDPSIAPDGTFDLTGLAGEGCLRMRGLPLGWRVSGVSRQGSDVPTSSFALEPGDHVSDVVIHVERGTEPPGPSPECVR